MRSSAKNRRYVRILAGLILLAVLLSGVLPGAAVYAAGDDPIILKIGNWEEYIDQGGWDEDEAIDLDSGTITSENGLIADFEDWYYETYGQTVQVEYSTFGTNEELYSKLTLGDSYDLVCPSEYMFSKLLKEDRLQPLSEGFFDTGDENNYYTRGVSPYIKDSFDNNYIDGKPWSAYAACYMWGTIGILYNPEKVSEQDASSWTILADRKYAKQVTIKDSVRESYFPGLAVLNSQLLLSQEFKNQADYQEKLTQIMNDTRPETIARMEDLLQEIRQNVYAFEVDTAKSDMVTGKIVAALQWSGDATYAMDLAEEEDFILNYAVPQECTNLWSDGWVMLKSGINGDPEKQKAAEAFINFISRPDNAIRNMYYIGYTSAITGGDDPMIYEYVRWNFEAEDDEDTVQYPLGYFFSGDNEDENYILTASAEQTKRQLFAQYPPKEILDRSAVMGYYPDDVNEQLNEMWINVRCFNFDQVPFAVWLKALVWIGLALLLLLVFIYRFKIFRKPIKSGYYKVD